MKVSSARWKSSTSRITTTPIRVRLDWISVARPSSTSWSSASTSLVMREISTPGPVARVEADRQRLQVGEELEPQVLKRALTYPADQVGLGIGGQPVDHRRDQEAHHHEVQRADVVTLDALVDRHLGQRCRGERRGGGQHEGEEHGHTRQR